MNQTKGVEKAVDTKKEKVRRKVKKFPSRRNNLLPHNMALIELVTGKPEKNPQTREEK